jgi:hypothetical protein
MHSFFNRIVRNAANDTARAFAGTAVSIALGVTGDFIYNKIKQPQRNTSLPPLPSKAFEKHEDPSNKHRP